MEVLFYIFGGLVAAIILSILAGKLFFYFRSRKLIRNVSSKVSTPLEKKFPEADIHRYSTTFFRVGMALSTLTAIVALLWTWPQPATSQLLYASSSDEVQIMVPPTRPEQPKEVPPVTDPNKVKEVEHEPVDEPVEDPPVKVPDTLNIVFSDTATMAPPPEKDTMSNDPLIFAEDMPVFPGGKNALERYLATCHYPEMAIENDIEGTVFIRFVVERSGKVGRVEIARGADRILDKAALKHIQNMPEWTPGMQRGNKVPVQFVVPIKFSLQ